MEFAVIALIPILAIFAAATWIVWQILKGLRFLVVGLFRGFGLMGGRGFGFLRMEAVELVQFIGAVLTLIVLLPLTALNFIIGRWSTGRHYARALEDELVSAGLGLYRIALGHPLRLVGLGGMLEGVERRIPEVVDRAPRRSTKKGSLQFDGYKVVGTLPAGGSGAQLFLAHPKKDTVERFAAAGKTIPDKVVIKSFALVQGSTLPQIVRESRALEAANRLGLVQEHHLEQDRFYYVMEFVDGEDLDMVVQRMHQRSGPEGLGNPELSLTMGYAMDLLKSLDRFHTGGLWHKDVKPKNLIVSGPNAHLVDFGLVTPLQSALTLTTHGTEYYRDPEMVRLAMQGVKVHEVDGVKFDLYSAGAVLFSIIENSFPAHGSLSQISKRCPEALAWIVRRSMADIDSRYNAAWEMLDDLGTIAAAPDPFALRPADLPSMRRGDSAKRSQSASFGATVGSTMSFMRGLMGADKEGADKEGAYKHEEPKQFEQPQEPKQAKRPYLLADQVPAMPRDACRRKRRRVLTAGAVSMAGLVLLAAFLKEQRESSYHRHERSARAWSNATASVNDLDLQPAEQDAYRTGREIVEEFVDDLSGAFGRAHEQVSSPDAKHRSSQSTRSSRGPKGSVVLPVAQANDREADEADYGVTAPRRQKSPSRKQFQPGSAVEQPLGALDGARILVLDNVTNTAGKDAIKALENKLEERGLDVVGKDEIEVIASAQLAVGTGHPSDDDAKSRLQEYLDESIDVDVIVWVGGDTKASVFVRSGLED